MVSICRNYDNYRNTITFVTKDTYNFDKTGFQIGVASTAKVVTRSDQRNHPIVIQPRNQE